MNVISKPDIGLCCEKHGLSAEGMTIMFTPGSLEGNTSQICSNAPLALKQYLHCYRFFIWVTILYFYVSEKDIMFHPSERLHTWPLSYF